MPGDHGIRCPRCDSDNHGVYNSRAVRNNKRKRWRRCHDCSAEFQTFEREEGSADQGAARQTADDLELIARVFRRNPDAMLAVRAYLSGQTVVYLHRGDELHLTPPTIS